MELDSCLLIAAQTIHLSPSISTLTFPLHILCPPFTVCSSCRFIDTGDVLWIWVIPGGPFWPLSVSWVSPMFADLWWWSFELYYFFIVVVWQVLVHIFSVHIQILLLKYFLLLNFVFPFRHHGHKCKQNKTNKQTNRAWALELRLTRSTLNCAVSWQSDLGQVT